PGIRLSALIGANSERKTKSLDRLTRTAIASAGTTVAALMWSAPAAVLRGLLTRTSSTVHPRKNPRSTTISLGPLPQLIRFRFRRRIGPSPNDGRVPIARGPTENHRERF
ncbi:hypothetical protein, partial [Halorubrum sp. ASP121]|uniref:hypothetical protein n=1 Tax=Halorubrum sp. ASP121 TaxID=1855858 RepID=UPI001A7E0949